MGVCAIENLYRVFLSKWSHPHLWVMGVYIVWVKGKKVTLKNPLSRESRGYLAGRPYPQNTREIDILARFFSFQSCAPYIPFHGNPSRELVAKHSSWRTFKCDFLTLHPYYIYPHYPQIVRRPFRDKNLR